MRGHAPETKSNRAAPQGQRDTHSTGRARRADEPLANGVGGPKARGRARSWRHHVQRQRHEWGEGTATLRHHCQRRLGHDKGEQCAWPTAAAHQVSTPRCCAIMVSGGGIRENIAQHRCAILASDGGGVSVATMANNGSGTEERKRSVSDSPNRGIIAAKKGECAAQLRQHGQRRRGNEEERCKRAGESRRH